MTTLLDSGFGLFEDCPKPSVVWTHAHTVSRLAATITSCLVDIQPVSERSVLSFIPHHTVHNNWRRWTRDGLEPGRKTIGRVVLYRSLWGPGGPIPRGAALRNNVNNHNDQRTWHPEKWSRDEDHSVTHDRAGPVPESWVLSNIVVKVIYLEWTCVLFIRVTRPVARALSQPASRAQLGLRSRPGYKPQTGPQPLATPHQDSVFSQYAVHALFCVITEL